MPILKYDVFRPSKRFFMNQSSLHRQPNNQVWLGMMVAQAPSGKKPLPDMMTSIRIDNSGQVEIVDQLLLP